MTDPYNLDRFVLARADTYETALAEFRRGRKRSDRMCFVFPQLGGLGQSEIDKQYVIGLIDEARTYLDHPQLGSRLRVCVGLLQDLVGRATVDVFGRVDAVTLRSSLTLFADPSGEQMFRAALERWCHAPDRATLQLVKPDASSSLPT